MLHRYLKSKSWDKVLGPEFSLPYMKELDQFLSKEIKDKKEIYPPMDKVFSALNLTDFNKVEVVIIGQDPYHGAGQAHGLCFSVQQGIKLPPSLRNIYKELHQDVNFEIPEDGFLESWAKQGVLMLNAVLTVEKGKPASHQKKGWETFTDKVVDILNSEKENLVFLLWGAHAQKKGESIDRDKHLVLTAPHPSPFSAHKGFFGCGHFSQTNNYLVEHGKDPIVWSLL